LEGIILFSTFTESKQTNNALKIKQMEATINISEIMDSLRNLTINQVALVESSLSNDESTTDTKMVRYFMEAGISEVAACYLVEIERDNYLSDICYSLFDRINRPASPVQALNHIFSHFNL
jgi:hypothetical protein